MTKVFLGSNLKNLTNGVEELEVLVKCLVAIIIAGSYCMFAHYARARGKYSGVHIGVYQP